MCMEQFLAHRFTPFFCVLLTTTLFLKVCDKVETTEETDRERKQKMDKFIDLDLLLTEIIESEVRYGQSLRQVIGNLLVPSRERDDIFTVEQLDTLFCNIEMIASIQALKWYNLLDEMMLCNVT